MSDQTGAAKKAAKKPAAEPVAPGPTPSQAEEDARLLAEQEEEARLEELDNEREAALEQIEAERVATEDARAAELQSAVAAAKDVAQEALEDALERGATPAAADATTRRAAASQLSADLTHDLPPAVIAILAQMAAQTAAVTKVMETMAEKVAGRSGSNAELVLSGDAQQLLLQLSGTVSDGGDGDNPLDEPVVFIAKGANTVVIKKSRNRMTMPDGTQAFTTGVQADFSPNGMYSTRNPDMVAYLKARPGYGTVYWTLGNEPAAQIDPSPTLERVFELTMALDDVGLAEMEAEERATHKRVGVLQALQAARKKVQTFESAQA